MLCRPVIDERCIGISLEMFLHDKALQFHGLECMKPDKLSHEYIWAYIYTYSYSSNCNRVQPIQPMSFRKSIKLRGPEAHIYLHACDAWGWAPIAGQPTPWRGKTRVTLRCLRRQLLQKLRERRPYSHHPPSIPSGIIIPHSSLMSCDEFMKCLSHRGF